MKKSKITIALILVLVFTACTKQEVLPTRKVTYLVTGDCSKRIVTVASSLNTMVMECIDQTGLRFEGFEMQPGDVAQASVYNQCNGATVVAILVDGVQVVRDSIWREGFVRYVVP